MKVKNKTSNIIDNRSINLIVILIFSIISWSISVSAEVPQSSGHGGFLNLTYSWFVGILTIIIYLFSKLFLKKYNWVITVIGVIFNLYEAIDFL